MIIEARIFLIKRQLRLGIRRGIDKRGITFSTPRPSSVGQFNDPCVIGRGRPTSVTQDSGYVPKTIVAMSSLASNAYVGSTCCSVTRDSTAGIIVIVITRILHFKRSTGE
jgi:hypothetical protein